MHSHSHNPPIEVIWSVLRSFKCSKLLSSERPLTLKSDCFNMKSDHPLEQRMSTWSPWRALIKVNQRHSCAFSLIAILRLWLPGFTEMGIINHIYPRTLCTRPVLDAGLCLPKAHGPMGKEAIFPSLYFTSSPPTQSVIL